MLVPGVEVSHESDENGRQLGPPEGGLLTLNVVPGGKLEELVEEDDRQRELHDGHPLGEGEVGNLENVLKDEKENRVSVGHRYLSVHKERPCQLHHKIMALHGLQHIGWASAALDWSFETLPSVGPLGLYRASALYSR